MQSGDVESNPRHVELSFGCCSLKGSSAYDFLRLCVCEDILVQLIMLKYSETLKVHNGLLIKTLTVKVHNGLLLKTTAY